MKSFIACLILAAALRAQVTPRGEITSTTVVANVGGRDITAGELSNIMRNWNAAQLQQFQANPLSALQQIYSFKYLATEAEKRKLADEEPWKSQIEYAREGIMGQAMANYERNTFPVSSEDMDAFYAANKSRYEQSKIKIIKLGFKEPLPAGGSKDDVARAAAIAVQNEHAPNRTEDAAKTLAADIIKQARTGADFAELAKKHSDDEESKAKGGDYGMVSLSSTYPDEMKKAVFALQPGQVSDPVRQPNALYIIRLEDRQAPPIDKVRTAIIDEIRDRHLQAFGTELSKKFTPKIIRQEFFLSTGQPPQPPKP
jgi:parvulin-like peptidyl-prolyl isomerase